VRSSSALAPACLLAFLLTARSAADQQGREVTLQGTLTRADYERIIEREFDVPPGTERIDIDLAYDDRNRTVIDLGLRGPAQFRGWSGGGIQRISLDAYSASYGYAPGPIEPGRWAVLLGVPNIRDGVRAAYTLRISFNRPSPRPVLRTGAGWYAGDLHSHSGHSDGRTVGPSGDRLKVPAWQVFDRARDAKLDFIALTDHNTTSHWLDVDRLQPMYPATLLLHAREVTTYRGHLNAFGERRFVPFALSPTRSTADLLRDLGAAGALISINHPAAPGGETCMGCGWNDDDPETMARVGAVEVVNGDTVEGAQAGWPFWARMLNRGHRLVAVGGSDEHTPDEIADRQLGRPTTMVFARELSEDAIVEGLLSGRVYVRTRGPGGPAIDFSARAGDVIAQMGGRLRADGGPVTFQLMTEGAAGQHVEWIRNGEVASRSPIDGAGHAGTSIAVRPGDWVTVILRDAQGPTLFGNAIYIER
jgi:hypothetical protein